MQRASRWWWLLVALSLFVGIVPAPSRAAAAVPVLEVSAMAIEPTAAALIGRPGPVRCEILELRSGASVFHYEDTANQCVADALRAAVAKAHDYDGGVPNADWWRQRVAGAIFAVAADARAAEGIGAGVEATALRAESALQGSLLKQQLAAEEIAGARLPAEIARYTRHGLNQAISREGVGVSIGAIRDTFQNPRSITGQSGGTFVLGGQSARLVINADGKIITLVPLNSSAFRILGP
jgi:hypothetical protein